MGRVQGCRHADQVRKPARSIRFERQVFGTSREIVGSGGQYVASLLAAGIQSSKAGLERGFGYLPTFVGTRLRTVRQSCDGKIELLRKVDDWKESADSETASALGPRLRERSGRATDTEWHLDILAWRETAVLHERREAVSGESRERS